MLGLLVQMRRVEQYFTRDTSDIAASTNKRASFLHAINLEPELGSLDSRDAPRPGADEYEVLLRGR